ncbi:hypothetical protein P7K49_013990 [Saguinus oedipus]|uniref:Uncharacterized protein n=1 Tax=Saguinus oedipus TaxID=9490 RepID=A0ABQ9VIA4_SAGOE|nr:hypothetical protein P7K49_013990 [Saguinus oedipus]
MRTESPIAYERGRIYFDNYRRCVSRDSRDQQKDFWERYRCYLVSWNTDCDVQLRTGQTL